MSDRRAFVAGIAAGFALASSGARAQRRTPPRVAILVTGTQDSHGHLVEAFVGAMREAGYVEGRDVVYAYRWAGGHSDRYVALAAELARDDPDIIVTGTAAATQAAVEAAPRAVILMAYGSDPVGNKLIASLARPGGRVTGLSNFSEGLAPKLIELLRAMLPNARKVEVIVNPTNLTAKTYSVDARAAARSLQVAVSVREVAAPDAIDAAFHWAKLQQPDGIVVTPDPMFLATRTRLIELAAQTRMPAIYFQREFVVGGGLLSYGTSIRASYARAASYADKILKGADPGTLPVEQPTKFELALNMKTASALGLKVPQALLLRVDEVIR